jgi:predicted amidophosphoribosyltransferase
VLPIWMMVVMTTLLALCFVAGLMRRSRRQSEGRCASCGYDLRASANRCPECGMPISTVGVIKT